METMTEAETRLKNAEYKRRYYVANKDKMNAARVQARRKSKYGVSPEQFDAMLAAQKEACAICGTKEPKGRGAFNVDHCHTSGVVRGLLCQPCNTALGLFRDDTVLLSRASTYLDEARTLQ